LKRGEVTEEDVAELHNFVLEGVDLYANEPTEIHPLYWNHSSQRWDDHPQSVESEMARLHEESLRIEAGTAAVTPSVWNLWGLIGIGSLVQTWNISKADLTPTDKNLETISEFRRTDLETISELRRVGFRSTNNSDNSAESSTTTLPDDSSAPPPKAHHHHHHHSSWKATAGKVTLSAVASFFFAFCYQGVKYLERQSSGMMKEALQWVIFVVEYILGPIG
jgi:hypothetical protein